MNDGYKRDSNGYIILEEKVPGALRSEVEWWKLNSASRNKNKRLRKTRDWSLGIKRQESRTRLISTISNDEANLAVNISPKGIKLSGIPRHKTITSPKDLIPKFKGIDAGIGVFGPEITLYFE